MAVRGVSSPSPLGRPAVPGAWPGFPVPTRHVGKEIAAVQPAMTLSGQTDGLEAGRRHPCQLSSAQPSPAKPSPLVVSFVDGLAGARKKKSRPPRSLCIRPLPNNLTCSPQSLHVDSHYPSAQPFDSIYRSKLSDPSPRDNSPTMTLYYTLVSLPCLLASCTGEQRRLTRSRPRRRGQ